MTSMGQAVQTELDSYDLSTVFPGDRFGEIPAGSNVLVTGGPMLGKRRLVLRALKNGQRLDQPALVVTSDQSADQLRTQFENIDGPVDVERFYTVDCSGTSGSSIAETETVKYVSSPGDLTGIGMGIAKCTQTIGHEADDGLRFGMLSLSTLLQYSSEDRVFNFTHVMTGRVATAGYLGLWSLDTASQDEQTNATLRGQFDYVAELREVESGERELRVLGGEEAWRRWEPL